MHSLQSLSGGRSIVSSNAPSPDSAINCFLSHLLLTVILSMLTSSSQYYLLFCLSFNNVLWKAVTTQDVTDHAQFWHSISGNKFATMRPYMEK
jgi:hypothetical protein